MNSGGDAAEQIVRMSLEGLEVTAKITGAAAKDIALLLTAVLKEEKKTKGKARLGNMIRSGKELKVFSIQQKDLKKFSQEAKRYGVLYCVLRDKHNKASGAVIDVIARAEDASKISRIMERFDLAKVDKASVVRAAERDLAGRKEAANEIPLKDEDDRILNEILAKPVQKEKPLNPEVAKTEKSPLSEPDSAKQGLSTKGTSKEGISRDRPSVREKLDGFKKEMKESQGSEKEKQPQNKASKSKKNPQKKKTKKGRER